MDYKTPLAKVRGLGSAHNGVSHWWQQRLSAIVLIPLSVWLIVYCKHLLTATHVQMQIWLAEPLHTFAAAAWIIVVFYHAALGLQTVVEDYVQANWHKIAATVLIKLLFAGLALVALLALLKIVSTH